MVWFEKRRRRRSFKAKDTLTGWSVPKLILYVWIIEHVKIQEIFGIATVQSTPSPCLCSLPLPVYGALHSPRNRILDTEATRMLSLRSDAVRRRPDLAKMCWSCATKHDISPTSIRSLRSRLSLPKQIAPRAPFSSHSRVHSALCLPHDTH